MKPDALLHTAAAGLVEPVQAAIADHGVIGDQRTAALVARDGTIDWCCLPAFDGAPVFAHLIDPQHGGRWRLGPAAASAGAQRYLDHSAVLSTCWSTDSGELELTDAMLWPARESAADDGHRILLRRLSCTRGRASCSHELVPGRVGASRPLLVVPVGAPAAGVDAHWAGLWCSELRLQPQPTGTQFELAAGESVWVVLAYGEAADAWDLPRAQAALQHTLAAWAHWSDRHPYMGAQRHAAQASLRAIRLLSYGPAGSQVAAPTTSLPERIGGSRNYDYRYAWVRDSSLALAILAVLGDLPSAERYMDWLAERESRTEMPLQVLYGIDGRCDAPEYELREAAGYRGSRPVRVGNHAAQQFQLDSLGYLADCAEIYLAQGGSWKQAYTGFLQRMADFTAAQWQRPDDGIWELDTPAHYVSSKAMAWVVLDRACKIHLRLGLPVPAHWQGAAQAVHTELMERGWCEAKGAFRQHYDTDELDASTLLIGTMGVLPDDHERVVANIAAVQRELTLHDFVWRFHPRSQGKPHARLDQEEGAFLPCTFWMASALARLGRTDEARALLEKVEDAFAPLHLFSEEYDPHTKEALGNYPLLFSHAEHLKAVMDLSKAKPLAMAAMMAGKVGGKLVRALTPE